MSMFCILDAMAPAAAVTFELMPVLLIALLVAAAVWAIVHFVRLAKKRKNESSEEKEK